MTAKTNTNIYLPSAANIPTPVTFVNADGTTLKKLIDSSAYGTLIRSITISNTDTTNAYNVALYLNISSTNYLLGTVNVPANSGFNGTAASVGMLGSGLLPFPKSDNAGNRFFSLETGMSLYVSPLTTVASGKTLTIACFAEDYS